VSELTWRDVWRALLPHYSDPGLAALLRALETDNPALCAQATTLSDDLDPRCTGACPGAYALWQGGIEKAEVVERAFGRLADRINQEFGSRAGRRVAIQVFIDWFDDQTIPREKKLRLLLPDVRREIRRRERMPAHV